MGVFRNIVSKRSIYEARLKDQMSVSDMVINNRWRWPEEWMEQYLVLGSIAVPICRGKIR